MIRQVKRVVAGVLCLGLVAGGCGVAQDSDALEVSETATTYVLTVPVSHLMLVVPKTGLAPTRPPVRGGGTESSRYFYFEDRAKRVVLSGWFENAAEFTDVRSYWESNVEAWKKSGAPLPEIVSFSKQGDWDVVHYRLTPPKGNDCHLRAELVKAGTWIDVHLSAWGESAPADLDAALMKVLDSLQVTERPY